MREPKKVASLPPLRQDKWNYPSTWLELQRNCHSYLSCGGTKLTGDERSQLPGANGSRCTRAAAAGWRGPTAGWSSGSAVLGRSMTA